MGKPNALSSREDHGEGIEDDNKGVVVITPDKIRTTILITDEGDWNNPTKQVSASGHSLDSLNY